MKREILRGLGIFMAALVVVQGVFAQGQKASAAHSAVAYYTMMGGVFVLKENGSNKISPCYCIEKEVDTGDKGESDIKTLNADRSLLLNTAFLFGFNCDNMTESTNFKYEERMLRVETQNLIWRITEDDYMGGIGQSTTDLEKKVAYHLANPSYVDGQTKKLEWNAATNKFETTLTNTVLESSYSANNLVKVDTTTLPSGVEVKIEGENIKITSTNEILSETTIKLYKRVKEKGMLVVWDFGSSQDQISLDYDEPSIAKVMELKIMTGTKPVVAAPEPTVEATTPVVEETRQEPVEENVEVEIRTDEVKEVTEEAMKNELDDVPKTADNSKGELAISLAIASAFTLVVCVGMKKYENKKRYI